MARPRHQHHIKKARATQSNLEHTFKVSHEPNYVGTKIGPLATNTDRWAEPLRAFASRGYLLAALGAGCMTFARFFNRALASLLGYVA